MVMGWFKGIVKVVLFGDLFFIMGSVKGGLFLEKIVMFVGFIVLKLVGVLVVFLICDGYCFLGLCGGDWRVLYLLYLKDGVMLWMWLL